MTQHVDYDSNVTQMNKFLDVLKTDPQYAETASFYSEILAEEYTKACQEAKQAELASEGDTHYFQDNVVDNLSELLDEIRQYVAEAVLWS